MSSFYKDEITGLTMGDDYTKSKDVVGLHHQVTFIPNEALTDGQIKLMVKVSASAGWEDVEDSTLDLVTPRTISFIGFVERIKVVFVTPPTSGSTYSLIMRGGGA